MSVVQLPEVVACLPEEHAWPCEWPSVQHTMASTGHRALDSPTWHAWCHCMLMTAAQRTVLSWSACPVAHAARVQAAIDSTQTTASASHAAMTAALGAVAQEADR